MEGEGKQTWNKVTNGGLQKHSVYVLASHTTCQANRDIMTQRVSLCVRKKNQGESALLPRPRNVAARGLLPFPCTGTQDFVLTQLGGIQTMTTGFSPLEGNQQKAVAISKGSLSVPIWFPSCFRPVFVVSIQFWKKYRALAGGLQVVPMEGRPFRTPAYRVWCPQHPCPSLMASRRPPD